MNTTPEEILEAWFGINLDDPAAVAEQFESFVSYAERHHAIVERFGRFPHRNETLGRSPTPEEIEYLASGGDRF